MRFSLRRHIDILARRIDPRRYYGPHLEVDKSAVLLPGFRLDLRAPVRDRCYLRIGADSMVGGTFVFESSEGFVSIGDRVYIGNSTAICRTSIEFESDIFVAWGCYFYDHDSHSLDYRDRAGDLRTQLADYRAGRMMTASKDWSVVASAPITIHRNAWIGMDALVLKGTTIGEGAIVGARSVVANDLDPWSVYGGNPARLLKVLPPALRLPGAMDNR